MPKSRRSHRSRLARRVRSAVIIVALCAVAIALIEKQPSYGAHAVAPRAPSAQFTTARRVASPSGLAAQVDPADGIVNQVVKVSWSGFHPTDELGDWGVIIYQCKANPASLDDCYTVPAYPNSAGGNSITTGVTSPDGSGFAFFEVRNSEKLPDLNCSSTVACSLLVWENDGNPPPTSALPTTALVVPITFARSSNDCPVPTSLDVRAEGEASPANAMFNWIGQLCQGNPRLALDYTETSSNGGRSDVLAGATDVGLTSLGSTNTELATSSTHTKYEYAPIDLNAIVVAFNLADSQTGASITDVTLTPRLLARLITDSQLLDFFNDPEFLKLNPGHTWPTSGASQPLLRAERNADTRLITSWMIQDPDAKNFIAGHDKYSVPVTPDFLNKPYPVDNFEKAASDDGFNPLTGEGQVALHTFYGVKPADAATTRPSVQGFFAIMDLATATQFDLPMAKLVNHAGKAVSPDQTGVMEGYKAMTTLDGVKVPNFASSDVTAYPLTKIDYGMVRQSITTVDSHSKVVPDTAKLKNVNAFLNYVAVAGQQHMPEGYLPLPAAEVAQTKKVAADIAAGTGPHPTTTTTTATTVPAPIVDNCCSSGDGFGGTSGGDGGGGDTTDTTPPNPSAPAPSKSKAKPNTSKLELVAAAAPNWSPASGGGATTPSPLWFVMILGLAALAARLVWYTSPKVVERVRARAETRNGDES